MNASWTYSKAMSWAEGDPACNQPLAIAGTCVPVNLLRSVYYSDAGNHKHNIVTNFTYNLPRVKFDNAFAKQALNGWVLEGTYEYVSGAPGLVGESTSTDNLNGGGGFGTRVSLNPNQSPYAKVGDNAFQYLNINAFTPSAGGPGTCNGVYTNCGWGNSGIFNYIGFPTDNLDVSVYKDFALGKSEGKKLEVRWETYNTLNHTEFTTFASTTLNLTGAGALSGSNTTFGQANNTNPARIMAFAAKLEF